MVTIQKDELKDLGLRAEFIGKDIKDDDGIFEVPAIDLLKVMKENFFATKVMRIFQKHCDDIEIVVSREAMRSFLELSEIKEKGNEKVGEYIGSMIGCKVKLGKD